MGADLYIKNLPDKNDYKDFTRKSYFRDSYNNSNLLWQFDLDYWNFFKSLLNDDYELSVLKAEHLLTELEKREPIFKKNLQDLLDKKNRVWDFETDIKTDKKTHKPAKLTDKERLEWVAGYEAEYKRLQGFLKEAIKLNSSIEASI